MGDSSLPEDAGVSVIIPHYGPPDTTRQLLSNLSAQVTDRPVEVIVVDDASPTPFPDTDSVSVIHRDLNGGFGSTVNTGARQAIHPFLLILNSDLCVDDDFVEAMARRATRSSPVVVGPRLVGEEGADQHAARRFPRTSHQFVEWLAPLAGLRHLRSLQVAVGYDLGDDRGAEREVDWLVGAALCLPTETFRDVGGFDERFFMNCEEVDLQWRLRRRAVPSVYLRDVSVVHLGGASSSSITNRRRWVVGARRRYATKWGGLRRLQVSLSIATGVNLVWNVLRRVAGRTLHPTAILREELALVWGPIADPRTDHGHRA